MYILEINLLSVVSFAITCHSKGCLFISFIAFFAVQKLLSLISSHLFIFITIGSGSERILLNLCQRVFCLFSSKSFVVSGLSFRSLIHFEFIFGMVLGSVVISFFYM